MVRESIHLHINRPLILIKPKELQSPCFTESLYSINVLIAPIVTSTRLAFRISGIQIISLFGR